jgi:hypothetical protein
MNTACSKQWLEIEMISQQMHDLTLSFKDENPADGNRSEQAWQILATLDRQRMHILENFINGVDVNGIPEMLEKKLRILLQSNQSVVDECRLLQNKIAGEISRLGRHKQATNAYNSTELY